MVLRVGLPRALWLQLMLMPLEQLLLLLLEVFVVGASPPAGLSMVNEFCRPYSLVSYLSMELICARG